MALLAALTPNDPPSHDPRPKQPFLLPLMSPSQAESDIEFSYRNILGIQLGSETLADNTVMVITDRTRNIPRLRGGLQNANI